MRMAMRFMLPLALVLGGLSWAVTPLLGELLERWLRTDVEMRSSLRGTKGKRKGARLWYVGGLQF